MPISGRATQNDVEMRAKDGKRLAKILRGPSACGLSRGHEAGEHAPVTRKIETLPKFACGSFVFGCAEDYRTHRPCRLLVRKRGYIIAKIGRIGLGIADRNRTGYPGGKTFVDIADAVRDPEAESEEEFGPVFNAIRTEGRIEAHGF